jgi:hypothetical protein
VSTLCERLFDGAVSDWLASVGEPGPGSSASSRSSPLRLQRLPRAAWPIVVAATARAAAKDGRSVLVLAPGPGRLVNELRPWLSGRPSTFRFPEVTVSFLDRPPAFDETVAQRLEALAALAASGESDAAGREPTLVVSSRRGMMRMTVSAADLAATTLVLRPSLRADPTSLAVRLVELGYIREALAEVAGQFALRGGILDVFPAAARSPVRAEFFGDEVETVRLYDPSNQRSIMAVPQVTVRPGRELLLGAERGGAAAARLRAGAALDGLRSDVRADWDEDLERLEVGAAFPGVELFGAYLDPGLPSLLDHLPPDAIVIDLEPERQLAEARELEQETLMLAEAEAGDGELPRGFVPPMVRVSRLADLGGRPLVTASTGEVDGAVDLGWRELEPLVGRPRAVAELPAESASASVILASEQGERVAALLAEAGVGSELSEVDLDIGLELEPGLRRADVDVSAGVGSFGLGFRLYSDAELFGRIRRVAARPGRRSTRGEATLHLEY